jgi:hypothetical protein
LACKGATIKREAVNDYERVGRFIYSFHRPVTRDDLDRKVLAGQEVTTEVLLRAGLLAAAFDNIVRNSSNIPRADRCNAA